MEIKIYEKPVVTPFININGIEFEYRFLLRCLEEIRDGSTKKDYELSYIGEMDKLVEAGLVKKHTYEEIDRIAAFYCAKNKEEIEELIVMMYEEIYEEI